MRCLAVIPARGGSVGIPRKNLALVGGQPLITWTIQAALASRELHRVVVSTDDPEIAEVAIEAGAEVPFLRPARLAEGDVHSVHAVIHVLERLQDDERYVADVTAMLLPTAPLRRAADIDAAVALLRGSDAPSVVGVAPLDRHLTHLRWLRNGELIPLDQGDRNQQRQDQEPLFAVNGAMFVARTPALLEQGSFHMDGTLGYVMPRARSIDIDDPLDLEAARALLAVSPAHDSA